jgi:phytol kinase
MGKEILYAAILALSFLVLFAIAELLYRFLKIKAEHTRKLVHVCTGLITLLFPVLLQSHLYVLALCLSFLGILLLSLRFGWLPSINNIDRVSRGSISYPVAVYVCFYAYTFFNNYVFFYLPVLVLAIADPMAALWGKRYPRGKYVIFREQKTLMGSAAFFISALVVSLILLTTFTTLGLAGIFALSMFIALLTCVAEAASQKGYDNLAIPFSALAILVSSYYSLTPGIYPPGLAGCMTTAPSIHFLETFVATHSYDLWHE